MVKSAVVSFLFLLDTVVRVNQFREIFYCFNHSEYILSQTQGFN